MLGDLVLVVRDVPTGPEHEEALARDRPGTGAAPHERARGEHLEGEVGRVGAPGLLEEVVIGGLDVRALLEGECVVDQRAPLRGGVDTPERRLPEPGAGVVADLQGRAEAALEPDDVRGGVAHVVGQVRDPAVDIDPEHHRVGVLLAGVADEADLAPCDIRPILTIAHGRPRAAGRSGRGRPIERAAPRRVPRSSRRWCGTSRSRPLAAPRGSRSLREGRQERGVSREVQHARVHAPAPRRRVLRQSSTWRHRPPPVWTHRGAGAIPGRRSDERLIGDRSPTDGSLGRAVPTSARRARHRSRRPFTWSQRGRHRPGLGFRPCPGCA